MSEQRQKESLFSVVNTLHRTGAIDSEQRQRLLDAVETHRHNKSETWFKQSTLIAYLTEREEMLGESALAAAMNHEPKEEEEPQREKEKILKRKEEAKHIKDEIAHCEIND